MRVVAFAMFLVGACAPAQRPRADLTTVAEASSYLRTGRYDEAVRLCRDFARAYAGVRCAQIGETMQHRPIVALQIARRSGLPTIYVQAGIHPGEIEGKDAGFAFVRDLLDGKVAAGALDHVSVVFVPVLNPDGHERFGTNHRPNQRGPEEMGFRTNGVRLNLNRDYIKADAPETQAVLRLLAAEDPVLFVDLHTTDGAKFEHDLSLTLTPVAPRTDGLDEVAQDLSVRLLARVTALGHLPIDFYPSFVDDENPGSGFSRGEAPPRFSHFYAAARGRLGLLVETHSWRTYRERAASTYHALQAVFEQAITGAGVWREIADAADLADARLGGTSVPLTWTPTPRSREIAFRGYAYEIRISELTGGTWLVYDETTPEVWRVPLHDQLEPALSVTAPRGGYVIDGGFAREVGALLDLHGIVHTPLDEARAVNVEVFRTTRSSFSPPYEGRTRVELDGAWTPESRTLERGAIFVPIAQPRARLILHMFEPALPDALVRWGLFNTVFEHKEYLEPYVVEQAARELLAARPELREEYEAHVRAHRSLSTADTPLSTADKLAWFARRHPAWDERLDLLPVYRTARDLRSGSPSR